MDTMYLILVINLGSTSTKFAVYKNEIPLFDHTVRHATGEFDTCDGILDQKESGCATFWRPWLPTKSNRKTSARWSAGEGLSPRWTPAHTLLTELWCVISPVAHPPTIRRHWAGSSHRNWAKTITSRPMLWTLWLRMKWNPAQD